jgi:hypothetical protein
LKSQYKWSVAQDFGTGWVSVLVRCEIFAYPSTVTHEPLKVSFFLNARCSVKCNLKPLLCFRGTILGPVLFTHFLEHLFSPVTRRSEEPNMGLPILGIQYLVNYSFWVL